MIFIDSNIPMYLIGKAHPNKDKCRTIIERLVIEKIRMVSDVEVIQEILHRYVAINRPDCIQPALDCLYGIVDEIYPIQEKPALNAKDLVLSYVGLSARDAIHIAIMKQHNVKKIFSFDQGFKQIPDITLVP